MPRSAIRSQGSKIEVTGRELMTEDVLPHVRKPVALFLVDGVLAALTHRSFFVRRASLVLFVGLYYLFFSTLLSLRVPALSSGSSASKLSAYELEDAEAARYKPSPSTPQQRATKNQLDLIIRERRSALDPDDFHEAALSSGSSRVVGVTAVVLNWKRAKGLHMVIEHLSKYPFIREIIIWNNRPVDIDMSEFTLSSPGDLEVPLLRVVNSPANMHDQGKHLACSMATYLHCYFNDDDWLNVYMDSLYVKYLECCAGGGGASRGGSGGRIASNTMPIIHYEHRRWRFANPDHDLHTGFTWLGTGAFAPRHLSTRFLNQLAALPEPLNRDQALTSDMFFSIFTNSYPEQMPNNIVPIDIEGGEVGWSRTTAVDQWTVVYANVVRSFVCEPWEESLLLKQMIQLAAVRRLTDVLKNHAYLTPSPFPLASPPPESHTRSPCANDGCLFITSLTPFPDPSALTFPVASKKMKHKGWFGSSDVRTDVFDPFVLESIPTYEQRWTELAEWPDSEWWTRNGSWHLAVDGKGTQSCWESHKAPNEDDYFGLTLVAPRTVEQVTLTGSPTLENIVAWDNTGAGAEAWEIFTVRHGGAGGWEPRRLSHMPSIKPLTPTLAEITLDLEPQLDRYGDPSEIRKIKFVSRGLKRFRLVLCGWDLDGWKV